MQNVIFFSKRIKTLRLAHKLSFTQIALLTDKKRTVFAEMEAGRITTSFEGLVNISALFGVSIDWLCGVSEEPYREDIIASLEQLNRDLYVSANLENTNPSFAKEKLFFRSAVKFLFDEAFFTEEASTHASKYTLTQRANIIFSLNVLKYFAGILIEDGYDPQKTTFPQALEQWVAVSDKTIFDKIKNIFNSKRARSSFAVLLYYCSGCLKHYKNEANTDKIFFDITKPSEEE